MGRFFVEGDSRLLAIIKVHDKHYSMQLVGNPLQLDQKVASPPLIVSSTVLQKKTWQLSARSFFLVKRQSFGLVPTRVSGTVFFEVLVSD